MKDCNSLKGARYIALYFKSTYTEVISTETNWDDPPRKKGLIRPPQLRKTNGFS